MNAGQVARQAFKRILVGAADASPEPDEYNDFIAAMNSYMAALEARGIVLGYTPVDNVNDELTVPPGALRGLIANMAIEVAPDYDAPISPSLIVQAQEGLAAMMRLGRTTQQASMPTTLPLGSGYQVDSRAFFGRSANALLTLTGNTEPTRFSAPDTPTRVNGFWKVQQAQGLRGFITGRVISVSNGDLSVNVKADLAAVGLGDYTFSLIKSGEVFAIVSATLSSTPQDVIIAGSTTISAGDSIELHTACVGDTEPMTVKTAELRVR